MIRTRTKVLTLLLALVLPLVGRAEKNFSFAPDSGIGGFSFGFEWPADPAAPGKDLVALEGETSLGAGFTAIAWKAGGEQVAETRVFEQVIDGDAILIFETEIKKDILASTGVFRQPHFGLVVRPDAKPRRTLLYTIDAFSLPTRKAEATSGPVALYTDDFDAVVFSPLDRFLVAMSAPRPDGSWLCGFEGMVEKIPAGVKMKLIAVSGRGVNNTQVRWGAMLRAYHHRQRADAYADVGLSRLGYWTDNGAYYYYKTAPGKNYHETLIAARDDAVRRGIPYGYFQIDSWWYPKHESDSSILQAFRGGSLLWEPIPEMFPKGLPAFQQELGLPLIAHNRWYNIDSPYCKKYECATGFGEKRPALPIDPKFWDEIMDNAVKYGVQVYEQDWLITQMNMIPWLRNDLDHAESWFDSMIRAAHARNLTVQLCMASPEFFLQQVKHPNVTQVRTSGDYQAIFPKWYYWPSFHTTSVFAYAVGIWPFKDNFQSSPFQRGYNDEYWPFEEALISTLSAGLVGPGDKIGRADVGLLLRSCRKDGLLLKPDRPAFPLDLMYLDTHLPWTVETLTETGLGPTRYVAAFNLHPLRTFDFSVTLKEMGFDDGEYVIYNWRTGRVASRRDRIDFGPLPLNVGAFFVLAPAQANGMALIGETDKFVTVAKKRIVEASADASGMKLALEGVAGENISLLLFAPAGVKKTTGAIARPAGGNLTRLELVIPECGRVEVEVE